MDIVFRNLFMKTEFMSVQIRLVLTLLILLHIFCYNEKLEYFILIFYLPLIMAIISPLLGIIGYVMGFKNTYIENEIAYMEFNTSNFKIKIFQPLYKVILLFYIVKYVKSNLTLDILVFSVVYIIGYYFLSDVKNLYKTNIKHDLLIVSMSIATLLLLELVRLKN